MILSLYQNRDNRILENKMNITRREMIQIGAGASAGLMLGCAVAEEIDRGLITKEIPFSSIKRWKMLISKK